MTRTALVRSGADFKIPGGRHNFPVVYTEMLLQISRDYPGLPDGRTLRAHEIRFYYEGLRAELKRHTRARS